ncbi:MAG: AMP-binding protein, partial [Desulfobacteraceae bacterium]
AKGVVLSQDNFCFIAHVVADYLNLSQEDRYALILPLCHTYGKSILLSSFVAGAAVVMMNNFKNMPKFLEQLANDKCTVLSVVPYHIHVLLKGINLSKYDISSLRVITSSANKLPPAVIDNLSEILSGIQIFSMYGLDRVYNTCLLCSA